MGQKLNETVCTVSADNLFYSNEPAALTTGVVIASGEGKLKRGTILAKNSAGKFVALGTTETVGEETVTCVADCVLCDDVDATSADTSAVAYVSGHFAIDELIVKDSYTLTDADIDTLRAKGIFTSAALAK